MSSMKLFTELQNIAYKDIDFINTVEGDLTGCISKDFINVFRDNLKRIYRNVRRKITIIDVGTCKGISAITMANVSRQCQIDVNIICVDTWNDTYEYYKLLKNISDNDVVHNILPIRASSSEAVDAIKHYNVMADIIYVNAYRDATNVINDINIYWPILENDGCIFGDNHQSKDMVDIVDAIDKYFSYNNLQTEVSNVTWSLIKPKTT